MLNFLKKKLRQTGIFVTSENAFTVEIPILSPVIDPGPMQHDKRFISFKFRLHSLNISSTNGINFCECVFSSSLCFSFINFLSSKIDTLQILEDVSIANIFKIKPLFYLLASLVNTQSPQFSWLIAIYLSTRLTIKLASKL